MPATTSTPNDGGQRRIRPYAAADREACLALLRSNTPEHFLPGDEALFVAFLADLPGPYFVIEDDDGTLAACGGIATGIEEPTIGALCWGIVRADRQGRGLGRDLTLHRLHALTHLTAVRINTTQKVQGFYEKLGFVVTSARVDGYGPGLDHVCMEKRV